MEDGFKAFVNGEPTVFFCFFQFSEGDWNNNNNKFYFKLEHLALGYELSN